MHGTEAALVVAKSNAELISKLDEVTEDHAGRCPDCTDLTNGDLVDAMKFGSSFRNPRSGACGVCSMMNM